MDIILFSKIFYIVFITLLGIVIGSFLNVVIYRTPAKRTIVKGHSMCMTCDHTLGALDLVPIFSWVFLKGKCRYCGAPIASRYCKIESLTGVVFLLAALTHEESSYVILYPVFSCFCLFIYLVMFLVSCCALISSMMIWYDTKKAFVGPLLFTLIPAIISIVFIYVYNNSTPVDYLILFATVVARVIMVPAICFIVFLIFKISFNKNQILLHSIIGSMLLYSRYLGIGNKWAFVSIFSLVFALLSALLHKKNMDRYCGILGASMVVISYVIRYISVALF